jgi:hypothetical protein
MLEIWAIKLIYPICQQMLAFHYCFNGCVERENG